MPKSVGKKNPFMSLWLSGANKVAGAARGHFLNEARRQQAIMTRKAQKAVADFWGEVLKPGAKRRKKSN
jgi:hypothetical protein